jgi:hypothetical protein
MPLKNATCFTRTRTEYTRIYNRSEIAHLFHAHADEWFWKLINQTKSELDILFSLFLDVIIGLCKYLIEVMMFKNKIPDLSKKKV